MTAPARPANGAGVRIPVSRILVAGSPGAGKTTLTRKLADATGLPVRHLDDDYWGPGWTRPAQSGWERHQEVLTRPPRWIIDGNYLPTLPRRIGRAQIVILLEVPTRVCLIRVLRRAWEVGRGRYDSLPGQVRAQAQAGLPVRATRDFLPLIKLVTRFRRRDWWQVADQAAANRGLIVAVAPGVLRPRVEAVRRRLARRGIPAQVYPLSGVPALAAELAGRR